MAIPGILLLRESRPFLRFCSERERSLPKAHTTSQASQQPETGLLSVSLESSAEKPLSGQDSPAPVTHLGAEITQWLFSPFLSLTPHSTARPLSPTQLKFSHPGAFAGPSARNTPPASPPAQPHLGAQFLHLLPHKTSQSGDSSLPSPALTSPLSAGTRHPLPRLSVCDSHASGHEGWSQVA